MTAQLIGHPDSALAECCGQGRWPREDFFVWFYLTMLINRIEELNTQGAFYRLVSPGWPFWGLHRSVKRGTARFPRCAGNLDGKGEGPFGGICHWRSGLARV